MSKSTLKILWLSNTPANGIEIINGAGVYGGWLSSLDCALRSKVELSVAFYFARFMEPFQHKGVNYYPICKKKWRLNIIKNKLFNRLVEKEELNIYLDIIRKVQPDLIHIHGTENTFCCIIGVTNLPVLVSFQGSCTLIAHKYFSGIEKTFSYCRNNDLWPPYKLIFNKSYHQIYKYYIVPTAIRERKYLRHCKYTIGRTDWDRRITRVLAPQSKYFHNDEILRKSFYKNEWRKTNIGKTIIHTTCSDAFFKGFETICHALSELHIYGWDIEWRVAGLSEKSLLNKIVKKKLLESYPSKGLIFLGTLNEEELVKKMLEADIYVMPSHIENSPNNLCEAMILGMPCITTNAGGSSSLLKDQEEGLIIQDGDPWSLAGAILELIQNPEQAIIFGKNARRRAIHRHDHQKIVDDLLDIYNKITE